MIITVTHPLVRAGTFCEHLNTCAPSNLSEPEVVPVTIIATRLRVAPPGTLRLAAGSLLPLSHLAATLGSRPSTASAGSFV